MRSLIYYPIKIPDNKHGPPGEKYEILRRRQRMRQKLRQRHRAPTLGGGGSLIMEQAQSAVPIAIGMVADRRHPTMLTLPIGSKLHRSAMFIASHRGQTFVEPHRGGMFIAFHMNIMIVELRSSSRLKSGHGDIMVEERKHPTHPTPLIEKRWVKVKGERLKVKEL